MMKRSFAAFSLFAALSALAATYKVETDKPGCVYRCGETATFTVTMLDASNLRKSGEMQYATLDNFGTQLVAKVSVDIATGAVTRISGTLSEPGFLRLKLPQTKGGHGDPNVFSVGFEPEKIKKGSPSPADFDEFWATAKAKLAKEVPLDPQLERIEERSNGKFDLYQISFATFGRRVYGFLSVPKDKSKVPFPVIIGVNAAGFGGWTNDLSGRDDAICAQFSVYDWPMDWKWKEKGLQKKYDEFNAEKKTKYSCGGYATSGISVSREEYFYYSVLLGINRAVDWIAAMPDVDPRRFVYQGTSQGGGFGLYLCGFNRNFTRAALYVPAITDTMGYLAGRESGWPRIVESNSSTPESREAAEKWAPYFDGANFASRIRCPVRVAVGFSDTTCPPCAVYAAYNEIPMPDKQILHGIGMTHSCFGKFYGELGRWLMEPPTAAYGGHAWTNQLFEGWYADPQIRLYGDTYWIFSTYSRASYDDTLFFDLFSSKDLVTWTKHPRALDAKDIPWARRCMWAPDAHEKDGKYYIFFSANDTYPVDDSRTGTVVRAFGDKKYGGIGVAVADSPEGPYRDLLGKPLIDQFWNGAQPIDQYVFKYKDEWYMIYGGWGRCNIVKLAPDFKSLLPLDDKGTIWRDMTPKDYVEGSVMFERKGKWYFMYSSGVWTTDTYCINYSVGDSPFGPFEFKGRVLASQRPLATGPGHHSVLNMPGTDDWYICYHRRPIPTLAPIHRVTCLDRMFFDEKGDILPIIMTE